jgi:hypothetical protein
MRRSNRSTTSHRGDTPPAGRRPRRDLTRAALAGSVVAAATVGLMMAGCSTSSTTDSAAADNREFVQGYSQGCTWPEEQEVTDDNPDIDVWEGVLSCRDEMSDPRVTGEEEWTLVEPSYIHYTTIPQTARFEASVVLTPDEGEGTANTPVKASTKGSSTTSGDPSSQKRADTSSSATSNQPTNPKRGQWIATTCRWSDVSVGR